MMLFSLGEIARIRVRRQFGKSVDIICREWEAAGHTRDEVIEAIWATIRFQRDAEACAHVNQVLAYQQVGEPLINGKPQHMVAHLQPRGTIYKAQF